MVNYAVSDMLTRIRNGIRVKKKKVSVISTNLTKSIAEILKREGFIENFTTDGEATGIELKALSLGSEVRTQSTRASGRKLIQPKLEIYLKWSASNGGNFTGNATTPAGIASKNVLTNLKCISRPGVRIYANTNNIPQVLGGLGITILSTSKGVLTDYEARTQKVGGEVLCMLW